MSMVTQNDPIRYATTRRQALAAAATALVATLQPVQASAPVAPSTPTLPVTWTADCYQSGQQARAKGLGGTAPSDCDLWLLGYRTMGMSDLDDLRINSTDEQFSRAVAHQLCLGVRAFACGWRGIAFEHVFSP